MYIYLPPMVTSSYAPSIRDVKQQQQQQQQQQQPPTFSDFFASHHSFKISQAHYPIHI